MQGNEDTQQGARRHFWSLARIGKTLTMPLGIVLPVAKGPFELVVLNRRAGPASTHEHIGLAKLIEESVELRPVPPTARGQIV